MFKTDEILKAKMEILFQEGLIPYSRQLIWFNIMDTEKLIFEQSEIYKYN